MYLPTIQESLSALKRAMEAEVIPFIDNNYVLRNVTPSDVFYGRREQILQNRKV